MNRKIMIVDDDRGSRALVQKAFENESFEITSVDDGRKAIAAYFNSLSTSPYNLIILDVSMPLVNGIDVLKKIRAEEASRGIAHGAGSVPIIIISGSTDRRLEALNMKCDDYLIKPFSRDVLLGKVKEKLG
ncbi:MAG: response regulator transcription factor [Candidatus Omnitrophica bacterium]|nr:response regulator transcription factor [Candidatus Omnitrophota bacterium]